MVQKFLFAARILFPFAAVCLLVISVIAFILTYDFVRDANTATGTIVDVDTTTNKDGDTLYKPTFTFSVDGRPYTVKSFGYVSPSPGDVGDRIELLYDPTSPANARINLFVYTWLIPTVTFTLGCGFGVIYLLLAKFTKKRESLTLQDSSLCRHCGSEAMKSA